MDSIVCFRDFEERDIDFVYRCKNNEKLWEYTVGDFHKFSYEEAVEWVHGCMRDDPTYKFWAICKNDETRDIVGWCSIAKINYDNKSAELHGIVIGDVEYHDGFTWIESLLFILKYVFETLCFEKLTTCWLIDHPISSCLACFVKQGSSESIVIENNGHPHKIESVYFTKEEYYHNRDAGDFEMRKIIQKIVKYSKDNSSLILRKLRHGANAVE